MSSRNKKIAKKVTIKHIADVANVSFSTVGKALQNDPLINKKTRKKILKIARDLNYYPNLLAKGLKISKTKTIGIILNDLKNPLYSDIIKTIGDILNEKDYSMILCDSSYDFNLERKNIITVLSKGVDGIIISPINEKSNNINLIRENNLKTIFLDCIPNSLEDNYVYINHEKAAFLATEHLINNGHRNILLLNGPFKLSSTKHFLKGYLQALQYYNINPIKNLIKYTDVSIEGGFDTFKKIYENKSIVDNINFTAVVTLGDLIAIGIYKASKEIGFKIPDDYSVVGYDNIITTEYLSPPLTTINQPKIYIGENSINTLLDQINNKDNIPKKIVIEPQLIERESVKKNFDE